MWRYLNPKLPEGMAVIATVCCLILGYMAFHKSGELEEIWGNRCLTAQKEWKQIALFQEMDQKNTPKESMAESQMDGLEVFYLNQPFHIEIPALTFQELSLDLRRDQWVRFKLSTDSFDWIYEKFMPSQELINQQIEEILGRKGFWIEKIFGKKQVSAFDLESIDFVPVDHLSCHGHQSQSEVIQLLQAIRNQRIGLVARQKTAEYLLEIRRFEKSLERRKLFASTQNWDHAFSWFGEIGQPYISEKLDITQIKVIDRPKSFESIEALLVALSQNDQVTQPMILAMIEKIKVDFPTLKINIQQ